MTYALAEEGKPVAAPATTKKEPGFEAAIALAGILLVFSLIVRMRNNRWF